MLQRVSANGYNAGMTIPVEPTLARTFTAFTTAVVFGGYAFFALADDPNPKVQALGALIVGFGMSWMLMRGWDWIIWRAALPWPVAQEAPQSTGGSSAGHSVPALPAPEFHS